jgi:hypothetical protein
MDLLRIARANEMRRISSLTVAVLICAATHSVLPSGSANGQTPRIGIIDFYGLRDVSERQARQVLHIKEGDAPPDSTDEAERRLEALPHVRQASISMVCCEAGKTILYVGIREKGTPALRFRPAPRGSIRLPANMVSAGEALADAFMRAVEKGDAGEDDSQGHALFHNSEARTLQERFIDFARQDLKLLRAVLRQSAEARHRALAAEIIAYATNKREVVNDLVYGMSDPDSGVRNDSMRALAIIARFARSAPGQRIKVPMQPFVEMLNSLEWTDRNKSAMALFQLTETRDASLFASLRRRALTSLVEMARWKSPGHAQLPFIILGRVGNFSEEEIQKAWESGNRESLINAVWRKSGAARSP